ncbi:MAG: SepF, FtsZ-interacting protein related to cell division [uncultured Nocardioidaceae bacterium]|uniref:Cell division protein SepF n=1 Tax=uncultured Nocardioidaceae bacterium TaxID=253824 RepID=A0A6J4LPZ2_9ACTN|nr:MAG: SepF, FtsZ-interacting protein related to cell division [uncultured Nocardioidaceae bacterium]
MSGAMRKMGVYLGLLEDTDRYDEDYLEPGDQDTGQDPRARQAERLGATVAQLAERRRPAATGATAGSAGPTAGTVPGPRVAELSRITTLHPTTYNEARVIGENFREGIPVIMNLSEMDDGDAKRLVDFAAGLVFAVHGTIERVTNKVFLLSPPNVAVTAEDKQRIAQGGFFNQS